MRLPTFLLTFILILTACAAPAKDLPTEPLIKTEPTIATFENSLLAVEWTGRSKGNLLFPLDPITGTALPGYAPIALGQSYFYAFSPDRSTLAAVTFPNENTYSGSLLLIDIPGWKAQTVELETVGWVSAMVFSPDGNKLAIAQGELNYQLTIFDLEQGVITAHTKTDFLISRLKFTANSNSLMIYGMSMQNRFTENEMNGSPPQVRLLDAADLSPLWSVDLKSVRDGIYPTDEKVTPDLSEPGTAMYLSPATLFAPKQNILYIVHADSEQLTTVDFDSRKVETIEIHTELSWFERLLSITASVAHAKVADGTGKQAAISPDGQFLYVVGIRSESVQRKNGNWDMNQIPLGLEIIRSKDGSRLERLETDSAELSLSPNGHYLYLRHWEDQYTVPWTEIFDTSSREIVARKADVHASPVLRINGEPLLVSTYSLAENSHHMGIFQPDDLQVLTEWTGPDYVAWLTP